MDEKARAQPPSELQGWVPELGESLALARVIDLAFDYRGNVTVVKTDGTEIVGYLFNRNPDGPAAYIQMFDLAGNGPLTLLYSEIRNIRFTGRDMAAGNSWLAWLEGKDKQKSEKATDGE